MAYSNIKLQFPDDKNDCPTCSTVISYINSDKEYEYTNFMYSDYSGIVIPESRLDKSNIKDIVGKSVYSQIEPYLTKALSGERQQFEFEWHRKSGSPHLFEVTYMPDKNAEGEIVGIQVISQDICAQRQAENKFKAIFDSSPNAILLITSSGKILAANAQTSSLFGYEKEELIGADVDIFIPLDLRKRHKKLRQNYMNHPEVKSLGKGRDLHGLRKDGTEISVEIALSPIDSGDGETNILCTISDINDRKQAEEELLKLSRAVKSTSAMVIITDLDGVIEYINPRFCEVTGYSKTEVIGRNIELLNSERNRKDAYANLWKTIASGKTWKGEFRNRKKDGSLYWDRASISCVKNSRGNITNYICIQEDVTHEFELTERLSHQASHDELTGLINRREFERRAERLITTAKQTKSEHALCYMDLDQFKVVNDTCGHAAGDELLRQLTSVLKKQVRKRDTLARLGGDEFGLLMEHCSLDAANRTITNIQKAIQEYQFLWEGNSFKVGVSMGLVAVNETILNLTEILKQADAACYIAKEAGRNRIHIYHSEDIETTKRLGEVQWVTRIHRALDEDRFLLYTQSIKPLVNSDKKHFEILVRMKNEEGEIIPPGAFLPAAERYNLITKVDRWVINHTFQLLANNIDFLNDISFISINLSGTSLTEKNFMSDVIEQIQDSSIDATKICFEITETAAIANLNTATRFIKTLKQLGCSFALDDFGSGLSSFGYLKNLPVDFLKIDGMFVKDIVEDPINHAMVKSINEIGHVMGMKTIAEFVENNNIKTKLIEIGVNYAQGYGIEKPIAFDKILKKYSK